MGGRGGRGYTGAVATAFSRIRPSLLAREALGLGKATILNFLSDKCTHLAAGVAYYVLLSLFPLVIFVVSILGIVLTDDARRARFIDDVIAALPLEAVEAGQTADGAPAQTQLEKNLRDAMNGVQGFSFIGVLGLVATLWAASGMFGAIRTALDLAWRVDEPNRAYLRRKLVDFAMLGGLGVFFACTLLATAALSILQASDVLPFAGELPWQLAGHAISRGLALFAFMVLYWLVPDTTASRTRTIWPGALLATVLLWALNNGFGVYVRNLGNYNDVYGTLGAVVVFLFWAYLAAAIILLGAELAAEYGRRRAASVSPSPRGGRSAPPPGEAEPFPQGSGGQG